MTSDRTVSFHDVENTYSQKYVHWTGTERKDRVCSHLLVHSPNAVCDASISFEHWFMSWLFLTVWQKQQQTGQMFGPLPPLSNTKLKLLTPNFSLAHNGCCSPLGNEAASGRSVSFSLSPISLSLFHNNLSFFQNKQTCSK